MFLFDEVLDAPNEDEGLARAWPREKNRVLPRTVSD
jgi:hypothetical protein